MGRLQPGQRALRRNIVRDLQQQGYDKLVVQRYAALPLDGKLRTYTTSV